MREEIPQEAKAILDKLRELYVESGGKPLGTPEQYGCATSRPSQSGQPEVTFDYGVPKELKMPEGSYTILGSSIGGNHDKFWALLNEAFDVEILTPKRDDSKISELDFQLRNSGPVIAIRPCAERPSTTSVAESALLSEVGESVSVSH